MLEPFKNRALLLKIETVEGTDATPAAATDAFQLFDGRSGLLSERVERPVDRPFMGHVPFVNANIRAFIEGGFEIVPPSGPWTGASKASIDALLQIAGMAKTYAVGPPPTLQYNPISTGIPTASGWFYHAGTLRKLLASRANISSLALEIGGYLRGQARIEGSCSEVDEAALPVGLDYSAFKVPVVNSTETLTISINGFAVEGKRIGLDFGNALQSVEHSEGRANRIRDRQPTWTAQFYRPAKASLDPYALWKAGTIISAFGSHVEPTTDLETKLTVRGQIEDVREVEIDGDYGYEVTGRCIPSDAGGDELKLEFIDGS